jgi:hypothetical protein
MFQVGNVRKRRVVLIAYGMCSEAGVSIDVLLTVRQ